MDSVSRRAFPRMTVLQQARRPSIVDVDSTEVLRLGLRGFGLIPLGSIGSLVIVALMIAGLTVVTAPVVAGAGAARFVSGLWRVSILASVGSVVASVILERVRVFRSLARLLVLGSLGH